jgi:hypothetical protein
MAWTTVWVTEHTHELLRELAAATGEPLENVLEQAEWDATPADGLDGL